MSETSEYNEQEMATYLFPFYAMLDNYGIELTCEKVSAELKEWLDAKIEAMKCCGNCKHYQHYFGYDDECTENEVDIQGSDKCNKWELRK